MTKKYFILHPAIFQLDGGAMFGIIPKPLWSKVIVADELNRIQLSLRVLLIQTTHRNILIDTGIGDYHGEKFNDRFGVVGNKNPLVKELERIHHLKAEDITDIIISHLHFDHVGGLGNDTVKYTTCFPNAVLHIHRQHYDYAQKPTQRDAGSFHPQYFNAVINQAIKAEKLNWLEGEEGLILKDGVDEIKFKCSQGHTPWLVHPYDENCIYMADLVPTSAHISIPWVMGYDISPGQTTIDKQQFYDFILDNNLKMIFEHDTHFWGATIKKKNESDYEALEKFSITSIDPLKSELFFD